MIDLSECQISDIKQHKKKLCFAKQTVITKILIIEVHDRVGMEDFAMLRMFVTSTCGQPNDPKRVVVFKYARFAKKEFYKKIILILTSPILSY